MATFDSIDLEAMLKIYNLPNEEISYNKLKKNNNPDIIAAISNNRGGFVQRFYKMNKPHGERLYFKRTKFGKVITEIILDLTYKKASNSI